MRDKRGLQNFESGNLKGTYLLKELGLIGRIILK
jgi:hypothetical protein